ncbi:Protein TOC75, chloroplastic [Hordeum vulgare]|nr:Protein TOC75, chloroplastic [Hordeum vulgare]
MNGWPKMVLLPRRVAYMRMPLGTGRRPRTGHEEGAREPIRFCVQIWDQEDIAMLFRLVMKQWLVTGHPRVVSLPANKWCEFRAGLQGAHGGGARLEVPLLPAQDRT